MFDSEHIDYKRALKLASFNHYGKFRQGWKNKPSHWTIDYTRLLKIFRPARKLKTFDSKHTLYVSITIFFPFYIEYNNLLLIKGFFMEATAIHCTPLQLIIITEN